jgi:hypothetical protein
MTSPLIKSLLGGAAIAAAVTLMPIHGAQAACWTDGWSWHCAPGYPGFGYAPAPVWGPSWGYDYGSNYNDDIPNDYPGPAPVYNNR